MEQKNYSFNTVLNISENILDGDKAEESRMSKILVDTCLSTSDPPFTLT